MNDIREACAETQVTIYRAALAKMTALLVGTLAFAGVSAEAIAAIPEIKEAKELLR